MKKYNWVAVCFVIMLLSSCTAIGDIFKTGMWFGIIAVVVIIAIIIFIISKVTGGRK